MPIEVGLGARRNSCDCPPCEESGSDSGSDSGITLDCCANAIPRTLYVTIVGTGIGGWDGTSWALSYTNLGGSFPHHWIGTHDGDVCGTGSGGPPYRITADLRFRPDLPTGFGQPCRWDMTITDATPTAVWCRPTGGTTPDVANACSPFSADFEVAFQITDRSFGFTCSSCFGSTVANCFVTVTE
jgi:hypothetical protein